MKMFYETLQQSKAKTDIDLKDAQIIQLYVANAPLKKAAFDTDNQMVDKPEPKKEKVDKERGFVQSTADNWSEVTMSSDSLEKALEEVQEGFIAKSAYTASSLQESTDESLGDELNIAFFSIKEVKKL